MRFIKKRNGLTHLLWINLWLYHCLITIASSIYVYRISPDVWLNIAKCWNCAVYPFIGCLAGRSVTKLTQIDMIFISFNTQALFMERNCTSCSWLDLMRMLADKWKRVPHKIADCIKRGVHTQTLYTT
jgi:hypothetical protein